MNTNTLPALSVANVAVRQHDGLYSLNDLHKAAGGATKHQPYEFVRLDQTQALIAELSKSGDSRNYIQTKRGKHNGGTFACRELVIAYAAWISAAFHLKVIRVFLESVTPQPRYTQPIDQDEGYVRCLGHRMKKADADRLEYLMAEAAKILPPTPPMDTSKITLGAAAYFKTDDVYSLALLIHHVKHLQRIFKQYNLYTHLSGLGSRAGIEMHDHFWHALTSASALERKFEKPLKAASRYMREKHGLNTGDLP